MPTLLAMPRGRVLVGGTEAVIAQRLAWAKSTRAPCGLARKGALAFGGGRLHAKALDRQIRRDRLIGRAQLAQVGERDRIAGCAFALAPCLLIRT